MYKKISSATVAFLATVASFAQTANNDPATIKWAMTSGTITEVASYAYATTSQFIEKAEITKGSGLKDPIVQTSEMGSVTQTMFPVTSKTSSASDANAASFLVTLKDGIAFTPTKVSFKAYRWKTDKGNFDATWVCDNTTKSLGTGIHPNRGAGSGAGEVSEYSYDISGTSASESTFGLKFNIYNFDVAADKGMSFGDIVIEGTLYGTVGQPLTYTLEVSVNPAGAGSVEVTPQTATYVSGTKITLSQQPAEGYIFTGWQTSTGKVLTTSDSYTFNIKGNTSLTATYVTSESLQTNDYVVVGTQEEFRAAIKNFNENPSALRRFIFLKNGTYDYGTYKNPESGADPYGRDTIKVDNVSLIGQSPEGVTITITPTMSSVSRTAPIVIQGTGTYLQDITMRNDYNYSGNDAQAAALMDKGHHTIGKNMRFVSHQDTYYSNTDNGQLYFEDSHFEGTVDFICGRGDVFFNRCDLVCVNRYPKQGDNKGGTNIAAPYTIAENYSDAGGHGYIFMNCSVDCQSQIWDFGRGWRGWPKAAFLNTKLTEQAKLRLGTDQTKGKAIDYTLRVGTKGIQSSSDSHYMQFYEYNTLDEQGNVVSPTTNVLEFTAYDKKSYETILKSDEIARFQLRNVYPNWTPDEDCRQVIVTSVSREGNNLSWTTDEDAKAFLIEQDGNFVQIVDGTEAGCTVSPAGDGKFTVRAANMMGGFGPATEEGEVTGVNNVNGNVNGNGDENGDENIPVSKLVKNGKIVIFNNGAKFNAVGQHVN